MKLSDKLREAAHQAGGEASLDLQEELYELSDEADALEEEVARLRPDPSMGIVGVQLTPAEYAELVSLTPDGVQVSTHASNLVRSALPGTQARVVAAARGTEEAR